MIVTNITTAANLFHALRRQLTWNFRKPMINFSPKANLRSPWTFSDINELSHGGFKEVIDDDTDELKDVTFARLELNDVETDAENDCVYSLNDEVGVKLLVEPKDDDCAMV
jgi:2-oxoglutarate dehydrogenase complex dehydrogenase (E1) component-like enzyme